MKKTLLFLILLIFAFDAKSIESKLLSDSAEIYLITCDPGVDLYSAFGHSAIQIFDKKTKTDYVYNYGVFDFDTPNFYSKFVRGKLMYKVSRTSFKRFLRGYFYEKRSVYKQKLLLNSDEKQKLFDALETNYLPENKYYLYDFLYNNCATKIIDIIAENSNSASRYNCLQISTKSTFRHDMKTYLQNSPWVDFGIDLALGLPADKIINKRESMFLPNNLMANINCENNKNTGRPEIVYTGNKITKQYSIVSPFNLLLLLSIAFVFITIYWKQKKITRIIDGFLFCITGFLGLFLMFLWFGTDHQSMKLNMNILWASPLNLLFLFRNKISNKNIYNIYLFIYALVLITIVISWWIFPQEFNYALFPFIILLAFRAIANRKLG